MSDDISDEEWAKQTSIIVRAQGGCGTVFKKKNSAYYVCVQPPGHHDPCNDEDLDPQEEINRLRAGLQIIRSYRNNDGQDAIDMQMIAAEFLLPGRFPTPQRLIEHIQRELLKYPKD